jgi:hypothetical protein
VCVCVLVSQHVKRTHQNVICGQSGCTIFFHIISYTARFSEKYKMCFWIFLQILSGIFLSLRSTEQHIVTNVHSSSCRVPIILVKLELSGQIFEKCSKT